MPQNDDIEEAVIDSPRMLVYKACLDEFSGVTNWWMPYLGFKPRGDPPIDREGAIVDAILNPTSRMKIKFSSKVTKIIAPRLIELEYAGSFIGTGKWIFEALNGKTKVQQRQNIRRNNLLLSLTAPFVDHKKAHSDIMHKGFKALNSYLSKK
jgi:hypothetical protein